MKDLFGNIYKGKKVLITGHTGFKGSWLAFWLHELGAEVVGYSHLVPTNPHHFKLVKPKVKNIFADVLHKKKLIESVKKHKPDIIFHLAAQPIVKLSYADPLGTFETNMIGTINVLEACRVVKSVKAIVVVTSDKCYQNIEKTAGYKEHEPMGGDDPYSASKGCTELIVNSYRKSFFNPKTYGKEHSTLLASARAGNVIGGGDWAAHRLIPDIVRAADKGHHTPIRYPHATRPWQHVLEPLSGYLHLGWKLLLGKKEFADGWNFGPDPEATLSVLEVTERTRKHWNKIRYKIEKNQKKLHEARLLALDSTKALKKLGWKNVWTSDTTFEKTINWYKKFYEEGFMDTHADLKDYVKDARKLKVAWAKPTKTK